MNIRALLLWLPLVLLALLLQSFFWVPRYERQAVGGSQRAHKLIEASIGDAKILNPILNADTASSRIAGLVFDGLLDLDENLALRPRLAKTWRIYERAHLIVDANARLPDGTPVSGAALRARIETLARAEANDDLANLIEQVRVLAPETIVRKVQRRTDGAEPALVRISLPERLELVLNRVEPELFERLKPLLGEDYGTTFSAATLAEPLDGRDDELDDGALAALVPILSHKPVIEFELRRGVHFHDGHEFDAGDVEFTYDAIMDAKNLSPRTSDFEPIESIEIIDRHRVNVVYKRLFSPAITAWTMGILPQHLLKPDDAPDAPAGMRDAAFNRRPVGTGPFRFGRWESDELIHLVRNADYWDGAPLYKDYYYRVIPDALTQEIEFRAGAVDVYAPQPHQAARYAGDPAFQSFSSIQLGYTYIGYNTRREPFDDPRVRRALSMALDVDALIQYVLYDEGERTTGPYPKTTRWYDHDIAPVPYDREAALAILTELGWRKNAHGWLEKDGRVFEFNLITNNGNLIRKSVLSIAQNAWRQIGVKCNTQLFEWAVFLQDFINPGRFDATVLGWSMGVDPDLYQLWHSSQTGPNQLNFVGYENAQADQIIERLRREYDEDAQRRLAHELHRLIAEDQPYTFLFAPRATRVLDRKIVMQMPGGGHTPVTASKSGDVFFHMNRWFKLEHAPDF